MYFLYILRNSLNQLYIGQTNNITRRINEQTKGLVKSAKYIKDNHDFKLVYSEEFSTRLKAMRREKQLKGWSRAKKEALIADYLDLLKKL